MVEYKCFSCGRSVNATLVKKRVRCLYCGSKILFKPKVVNSKVRAV